MSFSALLDGLDSAVSSHLCDEALWTPRGAGEAVALRVQPVVEDVAEPVANTAMLRNVTRRLFMAAERDLQMLRDAGLIGPATGLQRGDAVSYAGETGVIIGDPRREDEGRRWWTFELSGPANP